MRFIKTDSTGPPAEKLAEIINQKLKAGLDVLWLVSGGSAVEVAAKARDKLQNYKKLTVMQVDERYGPVGHDDSNMKKLVDAGFNFQGVFSYPVLFGKDILETTDKYNEILKEQFRKSDFCVALLGIGADGHMAGILPDSPGLDDNKLVANYEGPDFNRITITSKTVKKLDAAVVYAMGESKSEALKNLKKSLPVSEQPAQLLKNIKDVFIFSDAIS